MFLFFVVCFFYDVVVTITSLLHQKSSMDIHINIFFWFLQTGLIQLLDQSLFLQPLPSHLLADNNSKSHLIVRRSIDDEAMENELKGNEKTAISKIYQNLMYQNISKSDIKISFLSAEHESANGRARI